MDLKKQMTVKQAAERLDVDIETIRRAIRAGKIEAIQLGRGYRIAETALEKYVQGQTVIVEAK